MTLTRNADGSSKGRRNRMGSSSPVMRAIARHLYENGPCTTSNLIDSVKLNNGKYLKQSRLSLTRNNMASSLSSHLDFGVEPSTKGVNFWNINPKSKLLESLERFK